MILFNYMSWSNWFSYGDNNYIDFKANTLTQILGANGSGKSSIPLILEESLYGKNSKNIKKQDITNRYTSSNNRTSEIGFCVDTDNYVLKVNRTATVTKLALFKNNVDISSHTSTGTYKQLENIIGLDFKTFSQLIYQSSKVSLEFLTATDTQRKNFLITLLNLDKYTKIHEIFKEEYKTVSKTVSELEGSCKTIAAWIKNNSSKNLEKQEVRELLLDDYSEYEKELNNYNHELINIHNINKNRSQNNQYKSLLKNIDMTALSNAVQEPESIQNIMSEKHALERENTQLSNNGTNLAKLKDAICPTCKQEIDLEIKNSMLNKWREKLSSNLNLIKQYENIIAEYKTKYNAFKIHKEAVDEFEKLNLLINKEMPEDLIDEDNLKLMITDLKKKINSIKSNIKAIEDYNKSVEDKNARIDLIITQIAEYKNQLEAEEKRLKASEDLLLILDILRQSFSPNGLTSYKIEYHIKELEYEINKYLNEFSEGRFQLTFTLKGEKLNVEIIDNNNTIDITALSSGELARVNISTLLAIRKLMSDISNTRLNLLFLDEIMGVLDTFGRDKLIEVLLEENDLNTFLVSHEYTHPLLDKLTIIKEKNISRIEYG